jgi:hypothetical protein
VKRGLFFLSKKPNSCVSENEVLWKIPASKKVEVMDWGLKDRALTQAVRCHPFTAETRVRARVNLCGFVVDKVVLGQIYL